MTICIAAIGKCTDLGKDEEAVVFATDHMISLQQIGQFEHSIEKYRKINSNTVAMLSGEALLFEDILNGIEHADDVDKIKQKIRQNMVNIRDSRLEAAVLAKFKVNYEYLKELLKQPNHNDTVQEMFDTIKQFNLKTSVIVAGFKAGKAHIAEVNEDNIIGVRDINFDAIGSGAIQAINTLLFQRHSKLNDLKTTLYNVYKAKRNSEVSVGVGKETDIFIMTHSGTIFKITEEQMKALDIIYLNELKFGKQHNDLKTVIENLKKQDKENV